MFRVKKDDQVQVISGRDKGKKAKVRQIFPVDGRVVVEGLNMVKRHMRRSEANPQGAILTREARLPLDRVLPVCPRCARGVRVGFQTQPDGSKARICRRCKESF